MWSYAWFDRRSARCLLCEILFTNQSGNQAIHLSLDHNPNDSNTVLQNMIERRYYTTPACALSWFFCKSMTTPMNSSCSYNKIKLNYRTYGLEWKNTNYMIWEEIMIIIVLRLCGCFPLPFLSLSYPGREATQQLRFAQPHRADCSCSVACCCCCLCSCSFFASLLRSRLVRQMRFSGARTPFRTSNNALFSPPSMLRWANIQTSQLARLSSTNFSPLTFPHPSQRWPS